MQNHERSDSGAFRKFLQEKGYYIVLFLCILAVGISGYVFIRSAISEKESLRDETLSIATTTTVPSSSKTQQPSASASADTSAASSGADRAEASVPVSTPIGDEAVRAAAEAVRTAPVSGTELLAYSVEQLVYNPTTRDWRTHEGVDLSSALGAEVRAACAGTVSAVYEDELLGMTVVIAHADGYATHYANLGAEPSVTVGQSVEAGQTIGTVGDTALLEAGEEPHLHFAVYLSGEPVDPTEYLS